MCRIPPLRACTPWSTAFWPEELACQRSIRLQGSREREGVAHLRPPVPLPKAIAGMALPSLSWMFWDMVLAVITEEG